MSEEDIAARIRQVDNNCAGPCKTATQAYASIIHVLADAMLEAESDLADEIAVNEDEAHR